MVDLSKYPISQTRRAGGLIFVSGQLPIDERGALIRGDIRVQTRLVIENLRKSLGEEGADLIHVVKVTTWLTDESFSVGYNEVYASMFRAPYPTRSTLISRLLVPVDLEMEAVACVEDVA